MKKNDTVILHCDRLGSDLEGVCSLNGMVVFVPGMLPGEEGEVRIVKTQPRFAFGKLMRLTQTSQDRTEPFCPVYQLCGGCTGQHMCYEATLRAKRDQVLECLNRIGSLGIAAKDMPQLLPLEDPFRYRNKTAIPCGGSLEAPKLGFYRKRSHDIIPIQDCPVAMGTLSLLLEILQSWMMQYSIPPYQEESGKGLIRHVVYRTNRRGDCMVILCTAGSRVPHLENLIQRLKAGLPGFQSLHISPNTEKNNVILGKSAWCAYGSEYLEESLLGKSFHISPLSFFQVNPVQTEKLYQTVIDFAQLTGQETVVDAYAGAGTISICMAEQCKQVIGIEIVPQAVESAKQNALLNHADRVCFYQGASETVLPRLVKEGLRTDVIVLDPPRKGCEKAVLEAAAQSGAKRIIYVSCHYAAQARDAALLAQYGYSFEKCQGVDMFCWTGDVENVLSLVKKG